jgi:putative ABC transport system permease protein
VSASAQSRVREFGLRLALGATPASVTRDLLTGAARTAAWGLLAGVPLAVAVAGALGPEIASDLRARPHAWLLGLAILATAALLAVLPPARRAARLDVARILGDG